MRYLVHLTRFTETGASHDDYAAGRRFEWDATECFAGLDDQEVPVKLGRDDFGLRFARGAPPWTRFWDGPMRFEINRLDDHRFNAAYAALVQIAGAADWHWIRYTNFPDGDELRFMRSDGVVRCVLFKDGVPRVLSPEATISDLPF